MPSWQEPGGLLSPAVCHNLTAEKSMAAMSFQSRLEDGQKYWVGKIGGGYFVVVG